jgi:hypothetical protein
VHNVLDRAGRDDHIAELTPHGSWLIEGCDLTQDQCAALLSGDIAWPTSRCREVERAGQRMAEMHAPTRDLVTGTSICQTLENALFSRRWALSGLSRGSCASLRARRARCLETGRDEDMYIREAASRYAWRSAVCGDGKTPNSRLPPGSRQCVFDAMVKEAVMKVKTCHDVRAEPVVGEPGMTVRWPISEFDGLPASPCASTRWSLLVRL